MKFWLKLEDHECIDITETKLCFFFLVFFFFFYGAILGGKTLNRTRFSAGSQGIVNLFSACMPREHYWYIKWEERRLVRLGGSRWTLGFLNAWNELNCRLYSVVVGWGMIASVLNIATEFRI